MYKFILGSLVFGMVAAFFAVVLTNPSTPTFAGNPTPTFTPTCTHVYPPGKWTPTPLPAGTQTPTPVPYADCQYMQDPYGDWDLSLTPTRVGGALTAFTIPFWRLDVDNNGTFNSLDQGLVASCVAVPLDCKTQLAAQPTITPTATATPIPRNKYEWPFAHDSFWNMPIGSNATMVAANLGTPQAYNAVYKFFYEVEWIHLNPSAPTQTVRTNASGGTCNGSTGTSTARMADSWGIRQFGNDTGAVLRSDNDTVLEFYNGCRDYNVDGSNDPKLHIGSGTSCEHDLEGAATAVAYCGHAGSGLGALGGSLRVWEVAKAGQAIRHALKLTLPATRLTDDAGSGCSNGYRWPAAVADTGWDDTSPPNAHHYSGSTAGLCMGALLALDGDTNCATLVSQEISQRICAALRDFGAYVVDIHPEEQDGTPQDWRPFSLNGEEAVEDMLDEPEMITLISNLLLVINNSSTDVGGGGTPLVPTAVPFP